MNPELSPAPETVRFAGRAVEPYREAVVSSDERVRTAVSELFQTLADERTAERLAEYRAILGYFEEAAARNEGRVPIEEIRAILADALEAKK